MSRKKPSIAIIGAGTGGLAVAATLRRIGSAAQAPPSRASARAFR